MASTASPYKEKGQAHAAPSNFAYLVNRQPRADWHFGHFSIAPRNLPQPDCCPASTLRLDRALLNSVPHALYPRADRCSLVAAAAPDGTLLAPYIARSRDPGRAGTSRAPVACNSRPTQSCRSSPTKVVEFVDFLARRLRAVFGTRGLGRYVPNVAVAGVPSTVTISLKLASLPWGWEPAWMRFRRQWRSAARSR